MSNNWVPNILKNAEFGKNTVNSLDAWEKKELRNLRNTLPWDFRYQENLIYTKNVNIWGETKQLGTIINNLELKNGKAIYKNPRTNKETPIAWRSELWALIQLYLVITNKYDNLDFREIDGIVWRRTLWAVNVKKADDQVARMDLQYKENVETNRYKAKRVYQYLKNNVFWKSLEYDYFPTIDDCKTEIDKNNFRYLDWYKARFKRNAGKGPEFKIDKNSSFNNATWKITLEFDPFWWNKSYDRWMINWQDYVNVDSNGKFIFNKKKFKNTIKKTILRAIEKWRNS